MWEQVARLALADSGRPAAIDRIDAIHQVHCMSWAYDDGPRRLAERLGIEPAFAQSSILAGTSGQRMINAAAERMLEGRSGLALVVGAEALSTVAALRSAGEEPTWSHPHPSPPPPIDVEEWILPTEWAHGVLRPTTTFAMLDTALRARRGVSPAEWRLAAGRLLAPMSAVAAESPHAWFPASWSPEEIAQPSEENRLVEAPLTKRMSAVMDVDMAAAVLLATEDVADELGMPRDRRVYLRSWAFGRDATHVAGRAQLDRSPAMAVVGSAALEAAGLEVGELTAIDLYSCFPASVAFAKEALGIDEGDPRPLTTAGGLPYHGGPSSNYTTHAVCALVEQLRASGGSGLVTGVGMHMTKHVAAAYATEPGDLCPPDYGALQEEIDAEAPDREVVDRLDAPSRGRIAAYAVAHRRDGRPERATAIVELPDGRRAYATSERADLVAALGEGEWVGQACALVPEPDGRHELDLP